MQASCTLGRSRGHGASSVIRMRLGEVNAAKPHLHYQRTLFYGNPPVTREIGLGRGEVIHYQARGLWFVSA